MAAFDTSQRITALTPVAKIADHLERLVVPVAPQILPVEAAVSRVLGADVVAPVDVPAQAIAARDGWAVNAEQLLDASAYAPVVMNLPAWVNTAAPMPAQADAVLQVNDATATGERLDVSSSIASFDGVLPPRTHVAQGDILARAGDLITPLRAAILQSLGIEQVSVRAPRVRIISASDIPALRDTLTPLLANAVAAAGGVPEILKREAMGSLLMQPDCDALLIVGGSGSGTNDAAVRMLAEHGSLDFHGFGVSPGETAALGRLDACPVLVLPGLLDAAFSVFLVVGSFLLSRLTGRNDPDHGVPLPVTKKISSTIGLDEVVFVRCVEGGAEPLGKGPFPMQKLMQADGWIRIPANSEGVAAGMVLEVRKLS